MKLFAVLAIAGSIGSLLPASAFAEDVPVLRPAETAAPSDIVRTVYEGYFAVLNAATGSDLPDVNWAEFAAAYLTPDLAARLARTRLPDADPLDVDFLIVAQDYEKLKLDKAETTASDEASATVRVTFTNMGAQTVSDVKLAKLPEGWRISDIVANAGTPEPFSLTDTLKAMGL